MAAPMMAYQKGTSIRNDTGPHDPRDKNQTKIPNTHHPQQRFREISRYDSNHFLGNQQARIAFLGAPHQIAAESRQPERKPTARPGLSGKRTSNPGRTTDRSVPAVNRTRTRPGTAESVEDRRAVPVGRADPGLPRTGARIGGGISRRRRWGELSRADGDEEGSGRRTAGEAPSQPAPLL